MERETRWDWGRVEWEKRDRRRQKVHKPKQEAKTSRKKLGRRFSTEGKFYLYKKYFMPVLLGNKIRVPSLKYYSAYRGKVLLLSHLYLSYLRQYQMVQCSLRLIIVWETWLGARSTSQSTVRTSGAEPYIRFTTEPLDFKQTSGMTFHIYLL